MSIATYGGLAIFGASASVQPDVEDRARQYNTYPGVNGVESLDQGDRGAITKVEGLWFAESEYELALILATWRGLQDGQPRTFVDTLGVAWPNVLLGPYRLQGRRKSSYTGSVVQQFAGSLRHLTNQLAS